MKLFTDEQQKIYATNILHYFTYPIIITIKEKIMYNNIQLINKIWTPNLHQI